MTGSAMAEVRTRPVLDALARVGRGDSPAAEVVADLTEEHLAELVSGTLEDRPDVLVAAGEPRAPGLVTGVLVLTGEEAERVAADGTPYVLALDGADVTDFDLISGCAGFVAASPAQTAFGPVQAVSCAKPTVIGVPRDRWNAVRGEWVTLDAVHGALYRGRLEHLGSPVSEFYELAWRCIERAVREGRAESHVQALREFPSHVAGALERDRITALAADPVLLGYWAVLAEVKKRSRVEVWTTAHTEAGIGRAQLARSVARPGAEGVPEFAVDPVRVGLMRDERMWSDEEEQDVLRLVVLGEEVVRPDDWREAVEAYVRRHTARLTGLFAEARGGLVVLRALCMPYSKLFSAERDTERLGARCLPDPDELAAVLADLNEMEVYQGCRGMRLLTQRPDLARLWLIAVATALRDVAASGEPARVRLLLPTITLPEEARRFLAVLDEVFPEVLGEERLDLLDGVSVMIETTGAYLLVEEFLSTTSAVTSVDGGMFGSNDFTAACFTVNREDSTRTIFPGYVRAGVLPASPFAHLDQVLVGPAILNTLDRGGRGALMGLGGELASDWQSVRWLADHAAERGLGYVTTGPETVLRALFASVGSLAR